MSETKEKNVEAPLCLADVLKGELLHVKGSKLPKDADLETVFKEFHKQEIKALCFSGGGIRSATFGLGIVQGLAKHGLLEKFDYLSTVSGGGYLGSWLSAWILRERLSAVSGIKPKPDNDSSQDHGLESADLIERSSPLEKKRKFDINDTPFALGVKKVQEKINCTPIEGTEEPTPEPQQLRHLREYSNYMSPKVGLLSADTWSLIGIYLRNLFLNLTIFVPLILTVLLVPRLIYSLFRWNQITELTRLGVVVASLVLGGLALSFVLSKLPSRNNRELGTINNTDGWVVAVGVLPMLFMAMALSAVWAAMLVTGDMQIPYLGFIDGLNIPEIDKTLSQFILGSTTVCVLGYLIFAVKRRFSGVSLDLHTLFATVVSMIVWAVLLWLALPRVFDPETLAASMKSGTDNPYYYLLYVCFSVPVFLVIFLVAGTVFVGLSSGKATDEDREWLARYGAWILIVCGVWIILNSLVLFGPIGLEALVSLPWTFQEGWKPLIVSVVGIVSGVVSLFGGFSSKGLVRNEPIKSNTSKILAFAPKIAAVVFLGFIFVGLAYATAFLFRSSALIFSNNGLPGLLPLPDGSMTQLNVLAGTSVPFLFFWAALLSLIGVVMACFVNVNKFSLHGAYRDRLVRAFLGASNNFRKSNTFTGFDDADNFQLHRLKGQKPFHVINATLNLISGKNLAWQNRKAASFTMTPLHSGSWTLGYRNTNEYCRNKKLGPCSSLNTCNRPNKDCLSATEKDCQLPGKAIRLGTAMAISGAAANPNMGYYSSAVVTFLMSLFNIRLGWWLGNTGEIGGRKDFWQDQYFSKSSPSVAILPLINETLGRTDENKRYINVTDGGHFENLALYEMVLRRSRIILLSDGAADADFKFGEISNAIQKCKVDLGVDIKFLGGINIYGRNAPEEGDRKKLRFSIAEIIYPERGENDEPLKGHLLYVRPAYYGTESTDIRHYAEANLSFPHQSTGDQMYDEKQFEVYRSLGFLTVDEVLGTAEDTDLSELLAELRKTSNA